MNGRIIADAIAVNPLAEFAYKPERGGTKVVLVRGLKHVNGSTWTIAESTDAATGVWLKRSKLRAVSRELVTVEDAKAQVEATISRNAELSSGFRKADIVAQQLTKLGVSCQRMGVRVIVHDVVSFGRLLAKVPT